MLSNLAEVKEMLPVVMLNRIRVEQQTNDEHVIPNSANLLVSGKLRKRKPFGELTNDTVPYFSLTSGNGTFGVANRKTVQNKKGRSLNSRLSRWIVSTNLKNSSKENEAVQNKSDLLQKKNKKTLSSKQSNIPIKKCLEKTIFRKENNTEIVIIKSNITPKLYSRPSISSQGKMTNMKELIGRKPKYKRRLISNTKNSFEKANSIPNSNSHESPKSSSRILDPYGPSSSTLISNFPLLLDSPRSKTIENTTRKQKSDSYNSFKHFDKSPPDNTFKPTDLYNLGELLNKKQSQGSIKVKNPVSLEKTKLLSEKLSPMKIYSNKNITTIEENIEFPEKYETLISKFNKEIKKRERLPKLAKPAKWIKKDLYTFLENKLCVKYPLERRYLCERLVLLLHNTVSNTLMGHPELSLPSLKEELILYDICKTQLDYFTFLNRFTPLEFIKQILPLGRAYGNHDFKYKRIRVYDSLL